MGRGIVLAFAQAEGLRSVLMQPQKEEVQERKRKNCTGIGKTRGKRKNYKREGRRDSREKIKTGTNEICERADLVIESVREDRETKKKSVQGNGKDLSRRLHIRNKHLPLCQLRRWDRGAGPPGYRHVLFNPAEVMKLVEVWWRR